MPHTRSRSWYSGSSVFQAASEECVQRRPDRHVCDPHIASNDVVATDAMMEKLAMSDSGSEMGARRRGQRWSASANQAPYIGLTWQDTADRHTYATMCSVHIEGISR